MPTRLLADSHGRPNAGTGLVQEAGCGLRLGNNLSVSYTTSYTGDVFALGAFLIR